MGNIVKSKLIKLWFVIPRVDSRELLLSIAINDKPSVVCGLRIREHSMLGKLIRVANSIWLNVTGNNGSINDWLCIYTDANIDKQLIEFNDLANELDYTNLTIINLMRYLFHIKPNDSLSININLDYDKIIDNISNITAVKHSEMIVSDE